MDESLIGMIRYLVYQQFCSDSEDILYSRDKRIKIKIPGIREVAETLVRTFSGNLTLLETNQYYEYLVEIDKILPLDIEKEWKEFKRVTDDLGDELNGPLAVNFLVAPIRSRMQQHEFEAYMSEAVIKASEQISTPHPQLTARDRLSQLYQLNDSTVSILYNLAFARLLASIFDYHEIYELIDDILSAKMDILVEKIVNESE
ncbi:MAG: hypothetical protein BAJATHORv1_80010 [Candidatus Thorarchaeota archaeon]|nr:MAG: hypothetical protein BAJATHORv1_80010 [Candidatus Thorarchaeota archaeon]